MYYAVYICYVMERPLELLYITLYPIGRPVRATNTMCIITLIFTATSIKVCPKQRRLHAISQDTFDTATYIRDVGRQ